MAKPKLGLNSQLGQILHTYESELSKAELNKFKPYLQHYYSHVDPDLLVVMSVQRAFEVARLHWRTAQVRQARKPIVRVYSLTNGASANTAIEIVTDNMPFLVDSVRMLLNQQGITIDLALHPVFQIERDVKGRLKSIAVPKHGDATGKSLSRESFIYLQVERLVEPERLLALEKGLLAVLRDVRRAVDDWQKMRWQLNVLIENLGQGDSAEYIEAAEYLTWLDQQNFTFLGYQQYAVKQTKNQILFTPTPKSALGVMRDKKFATEDYVINPKPSGNKPVHQPLLLITKSVQRSTVHRQGYLDCIIVRHLNKQGKVTSESRFVGLYTSTAYRRHPSDVPVIKSKIKRVFNKAGFDPVSHIGKAFLHILETYPRDELMQISESDLYEIARAVLHLGDRQRLKLFIREDALRRFLSCLVYVPRDRYDTNLRLSMAEIIQQQFGGLKPDFNVRLSDEAFARIEFFIRTDPESFPEYECQALEQMLEEASHSWQDKLKQLLLVEFPEQECVDVVHNYQQAFSTAYQEEYSVEQAVRDITQLQLLEQGRDVAVDLYQPSAEEKLHLRIYKEGEAIAPSDALPILEKMGVRVLQQRPYPIRRKDKRRFWINEYVLECKFRSKALEQFKSDFEEIFIATWFEEVENDGFNTLGLLASLSVREIALLRALCKYLLQGTLTYSGVYMEQCLQRYPGVASDIVQLFHLRFDPKMQDDKNNKKQVRLENRIRKQLNDINSLDDDRILSNFLGLVLAAVRVNYYQSNKPYISLKFDTAKVAELPEPRPMFEIFVYSPRMEGVHLRAGKVARGGLRWSDRREDFRTEVLGLVKAQKVKNAIIVPTGAKGGFVVKQPPQGDREAFLNEGIACYKQFISGLLDITDNNQGNKLVPPADVVRYDEDDPYMVVAADKGTAAFSDIANSVAADYGFWLGDAFASGGSNGYDHKKMGITARGAWESVKLLFRDLGKDIQSEPFTVVGIGDMGGDVFGNGMLLSKKIKLVAAFNHMHIFLDPNPDPAASFKERQRLFRLPRSSWEDYDRKLISRGGGVFARSTKSIKLSAQVQKLVGIEKKSVTPNELISLLLAAPVELLWNGGIGTYIKASHEQHNQVGDRANDALRINASQLKCKVVGEGGNLGLTQAARIEFALQGGSVDSDFIHNAGGVDCSDHEVNIKILLNQALRAKKLTEVQRVKLLEDMTEEVAAQVLHSNYWQGQAITLIYAEAAQYLEEHSRYMRKLESIGLLQRQLEELPDDEQLLERKAMSKGLTRPEIAVLVSYSKILAESELVDSDLWDDPYFAEELLRYFPVLLRDRFAGFIHKHPLRSEILATFIVNRMVNRMGCTYLYRVQEETGSGIADIARAYTISWEVFGLRQMWSEIAALDHKVPAETLIDMMLEAVRLIDRASIWILRSRRQLLSVREMIGLYQKGATTLQQKLPEMLDISADPIIKNTLQEYVERGVSRELASKVLAMDALYCTFDVVDISNSSNLPLPSVSDTYFALSAYLDVYWLRVQLRDHVADTHWQELARKSQLDDLYRILGLLTRDVLRVSAGIGQPAQRIQKWHEVNAIAVDRYLHMSQELRAVEHLDLAMFTVALRELQNLHQACSSA